MGSGICGLIGGKVCATVATAIATTAAMSRPEHRAAVDATALALVAAAAAGPHDECRAMAGGVDADKGAPNDAHVWLAPHDRRVRAAQRGQTAGARTWRRLRRQLSIGRR